MISFAEFAGLRLLPFVRDASEVVPLGEWEFMDDLWTGEAIGFTQFLRLEEEPGVLRALALDLEMLPDSVAQAVLAAVEVPLWYGMDEDEVVRRMGPPTGAVRYGSRATVEFTVDAGVRYEVSCTLTPGEGLVYLCILAPTPRRLAVARDEGW